MVARLQPRGRSA